MQIIQNITQMPTVDLILIGAAVVAVTFGVWLDKVKFQD